MSEKFPWRDYRHTIGQAIIAGFILLVFMALIIGIGEQKASTQGSDDDFDDRCIEWYEDQFGRGEDREPVERVPLF